MRVGGVLEGVGARAHLERGFRSWELDFRSGVRWDHRPYDEGVVVDVPARLRPSVRDVVGRLRRGEAAAGDGGDPDPAPAGLHGLHSRDRAVQPVGDRTQGVVVELRHLPRVDAPVGQHRVPALPDRRRAHRHRVQPGRATLLDEHPVRVGDQVTVGAGGPGSSGGAAGSGQSPSMPELSYKNAAVGAKTWMSPVHSTGASLWVRRTGGRSGSPTPLWEEVVPLPVTRTWCRGPAPTSRSGPASRRTPHRRRSRSAGSGRSWSVRFRRCRES